MRAREAETPRRQSSRIRRSFVAGRNGELHERNSAPVLNRCPPLPKLPLQSDGCPHSGNPKGGVGNTPT